MTVFVVRNRTEAKEKVLFPFIFLSSMDRQGERESEHSDNSFWLRTEGKKRKKEERKKNVFDFIQWFKIYVDR